MKKEVKITNKMLHQQYKLRRTLHVFESGEIKSTRNRFAALFPVSWKKIEQKKQNPIYSSFSDCAQFPAINIIISVSSPLGWNSHAKPSLRRPLRQSIGGNLRLYDLSLQGLTVLQLVTDLRSLLKIESQVVRSPTPPPPPPTLQWLAC
jgi:hypothetical protein